jgi:phosphatidate cytidylyltransferase
MINFLKRVVTAIILGTLFFGSYFYYPKMFALILILILVFVLIFEWPKLVSVKTLKFWIITPFYPILPVFCLLYLWHNYYNVNYLIPLYPFFVSWIFDTGSYLAGKTFGKHKVCPSISPGKSWEGVFGGFLALVAFNKYFLPNLVWWKILLISAALSFVAFLGDIFISFWKRKSDLKDIGGLLPGHGGLLDRFDSVFFVVVPYTFYILMI